MYYEINNLEKLEDELILIRKFLMNKFLHKIKYDDRFKIYDYRIRFNEDIKEFNLTLNNFMEFLRTNYTDEERIIKLYNFLVFIDYDSIYIKNGKYTIKRKDYTVSDKIQLFKISYKEILGRLINFEIIHNTKRFSLVFRNRYYTADSLEDPYYKKYLH